MDVRSVLSDRADYAVVVVLAVLAAIVPLVTPSGFVNKLLVQMFIYVGLVATWNLIGYTGYINFGQAAFYGLGAYVLGLSVAVAHLPVVLGVVLAGVITALLGLVMGAITMKLSGHYFSISTLLMLIITTVVFSNLGDFVPSTGSEITLPIATFGFADADTVFYYLLFLVALGLVVFSIWLERTKWGYGMKAISEDEDIARSLGVSTLRLKVLSMVLSGFGAGVVGGIYAYNIGYIDTSIYFGLTLTFLIVFMGFVGSVGRWYGPLVGVLLFVPADQILTYNVSPEIARIGFGAIFVVVMLLLPQGLGRFVAERVRDRRSARTGSGGRDAPAESSD